MKPVLSISLVLAATLLGGCLSRSPVKARAFLFAVPAGQIPGTASTFRGPIAIRRVRVAAPFDGQSLVYRTGEYSYESDPYAEFFAPCSETLDCAISQWLRESGCFQSVIEPGSADHPAAMAEINVEELYGDFRAAQPTAVLTAQFVLFDATNGIAGQRLLDREYSRRVPVKARSAAALMAGWNQALREILQQFTSDVCALNSTAPGQIVSPRAAL